MVVWLSYHLHQLQADIDSSRFLEFDNIVYNDTLIYCKDKEFSRLICNVWLNHFKLLNDSKEYLLLVWNVIFVK